MSFILRLNIKFRNKKLHRFVLRLSKWRVRLTKKLLSIGIPTGWLSFIESCNDEHSNQQGISNVENVHADIANFILTLYFERRDA